MIGRMMEPQMARNGTYTVTISGIREDVYGLWDTLKDQDCEIEIGKIKKKRSLNANAYAWALMGQIAGKLQGVAVNDYYARLIREAGIKTDIICVPEKAAQSVMEGWSHHGTGWMAEKLDSKIKSCVNLRLIYGSSSFTGQEMARLLDLIIQDAESLGIPTMTENEIKKMLGRWAHGKEPPAG